MDAFVDTKLFSFNGTFLPIPHIYFSYLPPPLKLSQRTPILKLDHLLQWEERLIGKNFWNLSRSMKYSQTKTLKESFRPLTLLLQQPTIGLRVLITSYNALNKLINSFAFLRLSFKPSVTKDFVRSTASSISIPQSISSIILSWTSSKQFILPLFTISFSAINIARPILHLLHISFSESAQLNLIHSHLIDAVEPSIYSYMLYDEEDCEDLCEISSSSA